MLRKSFLFMIGALVAGSLFIFTGCYSSDFYPRFLAEEAQPTEYPEVASSAEDASLYEHPTEAEQVPENESELENEPYLQEGHDEYTYDEDESEAAYIALVEYTPYSLDHAIVTRVIDGDTIELDCGERVRFIGVDAPEIGEPGADEATQFVRDHVYGQIVWLESDGNDSDRFGRLRRYIWLSYPTDTQEVEQIMTYQLNALLLIHGLAEVMILGSPRNEELFRSIAQPIVAEQAPQTQTPANPQFIGNRNSQIFHTLTCSTLPVEHNRIYFATREYAIAEGHRACSRCNP